MEEVWKVIEEFPNYEVSNMGRVRNRKTGRVLALINTSNGYHQVHLSQEGFKTHKYVHRLVATAFIPNPDNLPQVNHKDENKINNKFDNLEWCDNYYNQTYGTKYTRVAEKLSKPVYQCDDDGNIIAEYISATEAARQINGTRQSIRRCCAGESKHHKGFCWRYAEQDCGTEPTTP